MEQGIWNSGIGETVILNRKTKVSLSKKKKKKWYLKVREVAIGTLSKWNFLYKDPKARECLVCLRNSKEATVAKIEWEGENSSRWGQRIDRWVGRSRSYGDLQTVVLLYSEWKKETWQGFEQRTDVIWLMF